MRSMFELNLYWNDQSRIRISNKLLRSIDFSRTQEFVTKQGQFKLIIVKEQRQIYKKSESTNA